ncbi:hypothetical protein K7X08_017168 [Anisodus acutangulus]|uniref:Uncharacterized protein n=1 Tax=Anisodus acutangulus TaxID=402998 RepID=A0A9Q1R6Y6_9SOLA|nr:hypothetical protein K7X08_017168 [Anisodus acutangulus]
MAIDFAEYQICVDVFLTTKSYVDIASISVIPKTTGGQLYYYFPFSAISDTAKLYNDLRWNITRSQGLEAVMRVRCSQGLQVREYSGNYCKRVPLDVDLPAIDCDKTIMVTLKHDDKLQDGSECSFQRPVNLFFLRHLNFFLFIHWENEESLFPPPVPLSSERISDNGIYLLENGEDCLIDVGNSADPGVMHQLLGISSIEEVPAQFVLQQHDNPLSKKLNDIINEIRRQSLRLCKKGDSSGMLFFSNMVEDKTSIGLSYVEFLVHIHRHIQSKMA